MRNLFYLLAVFISFPLARAAAAVAAADLAAAAARPDPTPPPFFGGREVSKKIKSPVASAVAVVHVCVCVGVLGVTLAAS
jgi:hypothetical protein